MTFAQLKASLSAWAEPTGEKGEFVLDGKQALDIIRQMWKLLVDEKYLSERGQLAADAAQVAAAHSE